MKHVSRMIFLLMAIAGLSIGQVVQSDHYVVNAGLSKTLSATNPSAVAFSRDGALLAAIDKSGTLSVFNVESGAATGSAPAHSGGKAALAFSAFGTYVASWGSDQKVILWDAKTLAPAKTLASTGGKPGCLAFSGDETKLACGGEDGTIRVFSVASGSQITSYKAHGKAIMAMAFEPSGNTVVSVGGDRKMTTGDAGSGQVLKQTFLPIKVAFDKKPEDEFDTMASASCTPDGSIFAIGGYSDYAQLGLGYRTRFERIVLYDASARRLVAIGDKTMAKLSEDLSISPDGKLVCCAGPDGKFRVWDIEHNQLCGQVLKQDGIKMTAATKVGGNYLFAVASKNANVVAMTASDPVRVLPAEQDKGIGGGLSIEFATPSEFAPIVNHPNLEVSAIVSGLQGKPRYSIDIAGHATDEGTIEVSDNKDLVIVPAGSGAGSAGPPVAIKMGEGTVRLSQNLTLFEGPNRIKVTVHDGSKQVTAVKTVCYVPDGELDSSKIYSQSHAIVIGINKYTGKNGKNIPALAAAVADAGDVAQVLKSQYGFQDVQLLTDANATHEKIEKALHAMADANTIKPNDRVVIFWSGHGQTVTGSEGGQAGFLLPSDAQVDFSNLDNARPYLDTCVAMSELSQLAREIPAKHVLILVDACFSGLAARSGNANPTGVFQLIHKAYFDAKEIITASSGSETAKEGNGHGYFTKALLEVFQDSAADENKDGFLTADELYRYLLPKVQQANSSQSPQMARFSLGIGEMLFFK